MKYLGVKYHKDVNIILNDSAVTKKRNNNGCDFPRGHRACGVICGRGPTAVHTSALDYFIKANMSFKIKDSKSEKRYCSILKEIHCSLENFLVWV